MKPRTCLVLLLSLSCVGLPGMTIADDPDVGTAPVILEPQTRQDIRAVYDVKDNVWAAGIGKGLYYVRGLLESYKDMDVDPKALHISIVLHGKAAYQLLNDDAYQEHTGDPFSVNPNDKVVAELVEHGISVEICHVTMKGHGWTSDDLIPGVIMVHDAYTRMIDLQQNGYAYIRF